MEHLLARWARGLQSQKTHIRPQECAVEEMFFSPRHLPLTKPPNRQTAKPPSSKMKFIAIAATILASLSLAAAADCSGARECQCLFEDGSHCCLYGQVSGCPPTSVHCAWKTPALPFSLRPSPPLSEISPCIIGAPQLTFPSLSERQGLERRRLHRRLPQRQAHPEVGRGRAARVRRRRQVLVRRPHHRAGPHPVLRLKNCTLKPKGRYHCMDGAPWLTLREVSGMPTGIRLEERRSS